jgi:hypothetical protein
MTTERLTRITCEQCGKTTEVHDNPCKPVIGSGLLVRRPTGWTWSIEHGDLCPDDSRVTSDG